MTGILSLCIVKHNLPNSHPDTRAFTPPAVKEAYLTFHSLWKDFCIWSFCRQDVDGIHGKTSLQLEVRCKRVGKELQEMWQGFDKRLLFNWQDVEILMKKHSTSSRYLYFYKIPGCGQNFHHFFKYILGRESRKAETEESNWKRKHGGDFEMIPATNWLDYVLGCQNSCRECNSAEKPISELLENVCKVTKQAIFIPFFNLI